MPCRSSEQTIAISQKPDTLDHDNPEWTNADFARAKPASTLRPEILKVFLKTRGQQLEPKKVPVSIRLSRDVVERFKADGPVGKAGSTPC